MGRRGRLIGAGCLHFRLGTPRGRGSGPFAENYLPERAGTLRSRRANAKSPMRDIQPALAYAAFVRRAVRPRMPAKGRYATFDRREETL